MVNQLRRGIGPWALAALLAPGSLGPARAVGSPQEAVGTRGEGTALLTAIAGAQASRYAEFVAGDAAGRIFERRGFVPLSVPQ